jgi:serine/threonine protein kinase
MSQSSHALPVGHVFGEYRIESVLGVGGFGLTYLAVDTNLDLRVAIKEYLPADITTRAANLGVQPSFDAEDRATFDWGLSRFLTEARTLASFRHPNIVRVLRFFQANNTAYMVMEFVQGAPLPEWMKSRRPVSQQALLDIALPILDGLGVIHKAGVLHRDVKPSNIYIRDDGSPVLIDFGAARSTQGNGELTAVVSPGYAPVEQYSESSVQGPYTDLYALGGVMYWMATGSKPVDATARIRNDPQRPARVLAHGAGYADALLDAIDWALKPNESERPQTVEQLMERIGPLSLRVQSMTTQSLMLSTLTKPISALGPDAANVSATPSNMQPVTTPRAPVSSGDEISARLTPAQLAEVEAELAQTIGPLAGVLVKRAAKRNTEFDLFLAELAREIEDEDERSRFTTRVRGNTVPPPPSDRTQRVPSQASGNQATRVEFSPEVLARAERRLAQHIGLFANVVVKKAAKRARDESELYAILAEEIDNPEDRKAFIRKAVNARSE